MRNLVITMATLLAVLSAPASAQMSGDEAYVRAMAYVQGEVNKVQAQARIDQATMQGELRSLRDKDAAITQRLKEIDARAKAGNAAAREALNLFSERQGPAAIAVLTKEAQTTAATAPSKASAVDEWLRIAELAEAVDPPKAVDAYRKALALDPLNFDAAEDLSGLLVNLGDLAGAEAVTAALKAAARSAASPRAAIDAKALEAQVLAFRGRPEDAARLAGEAAAGYAAIDAKKDAADSLRTQALALVLQRSFARADAVLAQAEEYATEAGSKRRTVNAILWRVRLSSEQGNVSAAEAHFQRASHLTSELNNPKFSLNLEQLGARLALDQKDYSKAQARAERMLTLAQQLGGGPDVSGAYKMLGNIALARKDYSNAERNYQASLQAVSAIGYKTDMASAYAGLGDLADAQSNWGLAESYYKQALNLDQTGLIAGPGVRLALGMVQSAKGDKAASDVTLRLALSEARAKRHEGVRANAAIELALGAKEKNDLAAAQPLFEEAAGAAAAANLPSTEAIARFQLARLAGKRGDLAGARAQMERSLSLNEAANNLAGSLAAGIELGDILYAQRQSTEACIRWRATKAKAEAAGRADRAKIVAERMAGKCLR